MSISGSRRHERLGSKTNLAERYCIQYHQEMGKSAKMIQKMRDNPRDWRLSSLEAIAKRLDIQVRKSGGSHAVFMHEDSSIIVTIPSKRPIKSIYICQFLALIDDIGVQL